MDLKCEHIGVNVSDIKQMKEFYLNLMGFKLIEETDSFFAAKAGDVRFSFFSGAKKYAINDDATGISIILRTGNVIETRDELVKKGIVLLSDIIEAGGFLKFFTIEDPDNNIIHIGEYLKDPLGKTFPPNHKE